jgi:hypothetical protein
MLPLTTENSVNRKQDFNVSHLFAPTPAGLQAKQNEKQGFLLLLVLDLATL